MRLVQHLDPGPQPNVLRTADRARDDLLRRGQGLPRGGDVLSDPGFGIAQCVGALDHLDVPIDGVGKRPLEELYDVRADPHQMTNLADDPEHAEVKAAMWDELRTYLSETGDPRVEGRDPWQEMAYRQEDGFGAVYNRLLPQEEREAARSRGKHAVGHTKEEGH